MMGVDELLHTSLASYRILLDRLLQLSASMGSLSGKEAIAAFQDLIELQKDCRQIDEQLVPLLNQNPPDPKLAPQIRERIQLLEEVIETNHRIMPQLQSRKAVLATELNLARENQGALSGYRSNGFVSGKRFNRSC